MNIKNLVLTATFLLFAIKGYCQTTQTKYFSDKYLEKETTLEKAKFKETVTHDAGITTIELISLKDNEIVSAYKGNEPVGFWKHSSTGNNRDGLDYSFDLIYTNSSCVDTITGISNYFEDNAGLTYVAPKIATGEKTIFQAIYKPIVYPAFAKENDIQGKVVLTFMITKNGEVRDIVVKRGVHVVLDKEAVRVLRKLKLSTPPYLNGHPKDVCVTLPVSFKLE